MYDILHTRLRLKYFDKSDIVITNSYSIESILTYTIHLFKKCINKIYFFMENKIINQSTLIIDDKL